MNWLLVLVIGVLLIAAPVSADAAPYGQKGEWVLALTWAPAYCEADGNRSPECRAMEDRDYAATHFSLHGLWPQWGQYCNVPGRVRTLDKARKWKLLPSVSLGAELQSRLKKYMPGHMSHLDRHEWIKHGTCAELGAGTLADDAYFETAFRLLEEFSKTATAAKIRSHSGGPLSRRELCTTVAAEFGDDAIRAITVHERKDMLVELRIHLREGVDKYLSISTDDLSPVGDARCTGADIGVR